MANTTDIRVANASAEVSLPGGVVVETASLVCAVNGYPVIQLNTHPKVPGQSQAIEIFSSDATKFMGSVQTAMFAARSEPDVTVKMADGNNRSANTKGYMVSPGFSVNAGSVQRPLVAVGEVALLSNFNPSVYQWGGPLSGDTANAKDTLALASTSTNPARRMLEIIGKMKELWLLNPPSRSGVEYQIAVSTDKVNAGPLKILTEIVGRSQVDLDSWSALDTKDDTYTTINQAINSLILNVLQMPSDDFLSTLQNFCGQFQLVYVPSLSDTGKFIRMEDKVVGNAEEKTVEVANISISAGNWMTLPVQQVLVTGLPQASYNYGGVNSKGEDTTRFGFQGIYAYPLAPYTGGKVFKVGLPPFMPDHINTFVEKEVTVAINLEPTLAIVEYEDRIDGLNASAPILFIKGTEPILKRHAKNIYADLAIGGATVNVTAPLDLGWECGKRYKVNARGGGANLFAAFLAEVRHELSGGKRPAAITTLSFTHVQCSGFTLTLN